ncbi:hypothetical protein GBAR_LOCUS28565 [Geodia barretti]|uniref:Uncharacterized protein n=1 Tax=Geodia barretti TaxID=519541 RepID=A0AA35TQA3_GEOBA|nr:hypothetical protein GBAR_LOCUS28565 [Geodia barretti]
MTRERSYSLNRLAMDGNQMQSKKQLMSPQVQQQDSWPDPHTEYVPDPPRSKPPTIQTKSTFQKRSKELLQLEDLIEPLTITNYKKKFHRLLCWEEKEHITLLHDRLVLLIISTACVMKSTKVQTLGVEPVLLRE